uniref:hypothetical protein n=1 Tax=Roseivirga sp. TaxID=1964215 RepID=UPI0040488174
MNKGIINTRTRALEAKGISEDRIETTEVKLDGFKEKIMKLIPAEITAAFLALNAAIASGEVIQIGSTEYAWISWSTFIILLVLVPVYHSKSSENRVPIKQQIAVLLAFVVWVFAIGGPFELWFKDLEAADYYKDGQKARLFYASIILPLFYLIAMLQFMNREE